MKNQPKSPSGKISLWLPLALVAVAALATWLTFGVGSVAPSPPVAHSAVVAMPPVAAVASPVAVVAAKVSPPSAALAPAPVPRAERKMIDAAAMAALMNNPAMKNMRAAQMSAMMQMTYHDLRDHLQLSADERAYFQNLLADKEMSREQFGTQMLDASLSAGQRDAIHQQLVQADQDFDAKIKQFINSDADYAYYQTYAEQSSEHTEVGALESTLTSQGQPISADQADTLAGLIYDSRQNFPFTVDFYDEKNWGNPQIMTETAVDKFSTEQAQFQSQVAGQAASLLTPAQLDAFRQNQTAMAQMMKMQLGYVVQMVNAH